MSVVIILTTLFRAPWLAKQMLWTDEFYSLMFTTGYLTNPIPPNEIITAPPDIIGLQDALPISQLPNALRADTHPPLFALMLRVWREWIGESELSARLFMLIWSLVGAGFLFDAVHRQVGIRPAWAVGLLYAVSAPMVSYGVEIRSYGMMTTLLICAANALIRIERNGMNARRTLAFAASCLAAIFTHYFALAGIVALWLYAIIRLEKKSKLKLTGSLVVAGVFFCVIQLPAFIAQRSHFDTNLKYLLDQSETPIFNTFLRALTLPCRAITFDAVGNQGALLIGGLIVLAVWILRTRPMLAWFLLALATIGQCVAVDLVQQRAATGWIRYTLPAVPAMLALLALSITTLRKTTSIVSLIVLLSLGIFASLQTMRNPARPNWKNLFAPMTHEQLSQNDIVVFKRDPKTTWPTQVRYAAFCAEVGPPITQVVFLDQERQIDFDPSARIYIIDNVSWPHPPIANHQFLWMKQGYDTGIYAYGPLP